ncbi:hypothetical protein [Lysobacter olei]
MQYAESYQAAALGLPDDIAPEAIEAARTLITDDQRDDVRVDVADRHGDGAAYLLTMPGMVEAFNALMARTRADELQGDAAIAFRALDRFRDQQQGALEEALNEKAAELVMDGVLRRAAA